MHYGWWRQNYFVGVGLVGANDIKVTITVYAPESEPPFQLVCFEDWAASPIAATNVTIGESILHYYRSDGDSGRSLPVLE